MATSVYECEICFEVYGPGNHKPLVLSCGHTFGSSCVRRLTNCDGLECPKCRKKSSMPVDALPTNYSLIPEGKPFVKRKVRAVSVLSPLDPCPNHELDLDHLCVGCKDIVCRKCVKLSHGSHRVVFVDDLLRKDPDETDLIMALKSKIETDANRLSVAMSVPTKIIRQIEDLKKCKDDMTRWNYMLVSQKTSVLDNLEAWSGYEPSLGDERNDLFQMLCGHWKRTTQLLPEGDLFSGFETKLDELNEGFALIKEFVHNADIATMNTGTSMNPAVSSPADTSETPPRATETTSNALEALESNSPSSLRDPGTTPHTSKISMECKFLPRDEDWKVSTRALAECSLASVRVGRRPGGVSVVSFPRYPLEGLPELLAVLGEASSGDMKVALFDRFWSCAGLSDERLQSFIPKHGDKIKLFVGCPNDALAVSCASKHTKLTLGVRLVSMGDVDLCTSLTTTPNCVCCIRGLPREAGRRLHQLKWRPKNWHFPDLQDSDEDWVNELLKPFMTTTTRVRAQPALRYYLPRCAMTEKSLQRLIMAYPKFEHSFYCEPVSLDLKEQINLEAIAFEKKVNLRFSPIENFFCGEA